MNALRRTPALRFLVPVATAGILIGGSVLVGSLSASAAGLPDRSAAQLLADLQTAKVAGLSGTVVQTSDLGIPSLPGVGGGSSSDLTSLISGTHTLRVWYAGTDKVRFAVLGSLGETDVIRHGADVWTWTSKDNSATHSKVSTAEKNAGGKSDKSGAGKNLPTEVPKSPQDAADAILKAVDPTTAVTTDSNITVAGRPAYDLVLQPKDTRSLIGRVTIAIDGEQHVPLQVQVFAKGQDAPAFSVGFSSVDFAVPDAAQFAFNPPPGAKVTDSSTAPKQPSELPGKPATQAKPKVVGTGWTSVLVTSLPQQTAPSGPGQKPAGGVNIGRIVNSLPKVSGSWGSGHVLAGKVFSVVITDDQRVAAGAVAPELLYQALSAK